jgi:hypothetical protein
MVNKDLNKWLIIIIILFICFIIIPIILNFFKIKEGLTPNPLVSIKSDTSAIKLQTDKIAGIKTNADKIPKIKEETDKIDKIKAETDKIKTISAEIKSKIESVKPSIESSSATAITKAMASSNTGVNGRLDQYNSSLTSFISAIQGLSTVLSPHISKFVDDQKTLIEDVNRFKASIDDINAAYSANAVSIDKFSKTITDSNAVHIKNYNKLKNKFDILNKKFENFNYDDVDQRMKKYTEESMDLMNSTHTDLKTYTGKDSRYNKILAERLRMAIPPNILD